MARFEPLRAVSPRRLAARAAIYNITANKRTVHSALAVEGRDRAGGCDHDAADRRPRIFAEF